MSTSVLTALVQIFPATFFPAAAWAAGSPGTQVGETYYDTQHNLSAGRQVDRFGSFVQLSYMRQSSPQLSPGRKVFWNAVDVTGGPVTQYLDNGDSIRILPLGAPATPLGVAVGPEDQQGYTTMRVLANGRAAVFYHAVGALGSWAASLDSTAGAGIFGYPGNPYPAPQPVDTLPGQEIIWPHSCVDVVGSDTVLHVVGTEPEGFNPGGRVYYWRGIVSGSSVSWSTPLFVDSSDNPSVVIEADPQSDEVTILYSKPRSFFYFYNADIAYRRSTDGGLSWGGVVNITNYTEDSPDRAAEEISAAYGADGTMHVLYTTFDHQPPSTDIYAVPFDLWHWNDSRQTSRTITTAFWQNTCAYFLGQFQGDNAGNFQIAKPAVIVKPAGAGGIADELIYAVWVQYGPTLTDCATHADGITPGGCVNGELWYSVSSDAGSTWDPPRDITGTETPNCAPGDCHSEAWVSAAAWADSGIYLAYVEDTHAGSITNATATGWSVCPYRVLALASPLPQPAARALILPVDPRFWTLPYWENRIEVDSPTVGLNVDSVMISNPGNLALSFTASIINAGSAAVNPRVNGLTSYSSSIAAGANAETLVVSYTPDNGFVNFKLQIASNATATRGVQANDSFVVQWAQPVGDCPILLTGDVNLSGTITSADIIGLVNYVFKSGAAPLPCVAAGDVNCGGTVTSADVIALVNFVFKSGSAPCDACTSPLAAGC